MTPLVIGHRGARRRAVENTAESLRIALDLGADGVEFDVQIAADGELVLFHDDDALRLANRTQAITDLTWRELRGLTLRDGDLQPQRVTHLDEAMELLAGRKVRVNAELKVNAHDPYGGLKLADAFFRKLEALRDGDWLVSSFHRAPLEQLARHGCSRPLAALVDGMPPGDFWPLTQRRAELDFALASVNPHVSLVQAERMALWREQKLQVWTWTANAPRQWEALCEQGVDAVITDVPDALLQFLRRHGKR